MMRSSKCVLISGHLLTVDRSVAEHSAVRDAGYEVDPKTNGRKLRYGRSRGSLSRKTDTAGSGRRSRNRTKLRRSAISGWRRDSTS
jgi:hypothetical protein